MSFLRRAPSRAHKAGVRLAILVAPHAFRARLVVGPLLTVAAILAGCSSNVDLGPCDAKAAKAVYTATATLTPAYGGQALIDRSCGSGSYCHTYAQGVEHYGAPAGLEMDMASSSPHLAESHQNILDHKALIWAAVWFGTMPPGVVGKTVASQGPPYQGLPGLDTPEGKEMLRNWLACDAPYLSTVTSSGTVCGAGQIVCGTAPSDVCANTQNDAQHCGSCETSCASGAPYCVAGACSATCPGMICGSTCTDTTKDPSHCGGCGTVCPSGASCINSACACPGAAPTVCGGACVNTQSDKNNCGMCGKVCANTESCSAGICVACGLNKLSADVQPILATNCATSQCHDANRASTGNLNLSTAANAYAGLVNVNVAAVACKAKIRVVPKSVSTSYLVDKLLGTAGICGSQMPKGAAALSASNIAKIEDWICGGALNN